MTSSQHGGGAPAHDGGERLRILYDTYWWGTGPQSGRVVVRELLRAWREEFPQDEFVLAVRKADLEAVRREFPDVETVVIRGRPHGIATLTQYPLHARRRNVDLAFTQNFAPPGVWTATFIHDVMYQTDPEWFTRLERAYFWLIPRFARSAQLVLTSSQHEAERIRRCNPRVRRVEGIGLSVSTELARAEPERPAVAANLESFLLTVGRLNIRKNLAVTLQAALASGAVSSARPVLVVGGEDGKNSELPPDVRRAADEGLVVFVPRVTDAELAWLYTNADLFLCLSLDEGFGLPPVEALHFGCTTIASDIAVFRENLGSLATYVDPTAPAAIAEAIAEASTAKLDPRPCFATWHDCAIAARAAVEHARAHTVL
jgi:glycosyltransferase involved in cell wall biosynthesis